MAGFLDTNAGMVYQSLSLWANYLETGDPTISEKDAKNCKIEVRAMTVDQAVKAKQLRDLATDVLNKKQI